MHRFFINPEQIREGEVHFPLDIVHQLLNVLRLGNGDQVEVLDNHGAIHQVLIIVKDPPRHVVGKIVKTDKRHVEKKLKISLFLGMTNREKVEWILQKGTEVGVTDFHPFISSRTLVQSKALTQNRIDRWERIIREAAEQSQRSYLPVFHSPIDFLPALEIAIDDHDLCLLAWEQSDRNSQLLGQGLMGFDGDKVALIVGPEGGFSEDEVITATNKGCKIISLGERILRMETAAIIFPALVLYEINKN
jgi:16S rRNA (uracil1498-N3)-methyltransferase